MKNCVIYSRFSSHGQNEQSIDGQVRICKEFAASKNLNVINIYSDKAKTGTNDDRPGFQRMIKEAASETFDYIIVYMFDRFARNRRDSIMYKEMLKERYGIRVLSALEPIAEDEGGEFYEMFLDWNAEKYSKRLSKRVKDGLSTSVDNGTYCGGHLLYGYYVEREPIPGKANKTINRLAINEDEAKIIRYVFKQYANGKSKKEIAESLNSQGYRYKGKPFIGRSFDKWLYNQKYTGDFLFGGRVATKMYPAIIDKELYEQVQERLKANQYFMGGTQSARETYLLTGKLFCGYCGKEMIADGGTSKSGRQYHYYSCKNSKKNKKVCSKKRESKDGIERLVTHMVKNVLNNKKEMVKIVDDTIKYHDARTDMAFLKSLNTRIANLEKEIQDRSTAFVKAKSQLLRETIEKQMEEYEILLHNLKTQKVQLDLERGYKLTRDDIMAFVSEFAKGDENDKDYQKKVIDYLVYQIFVKDDKLVVALNITVSNKEIEYISSEDVTTHMGTSVQALTPSLRHENLRTNEFGDFFLCRARESNKLCSHTAHNLLCP